MTFSSAPRQDTAASIVGGLLGGLVVAGSVFAFFTLRDPRPATDESVAELRIAVAELRAQTAELRAEIATRPQPPQPPQPPAVVMYPPPPPPRVELSLPEPPFRPADDAVSCSAENRCTLDRTYLLELAANPSAVTRQMRVIPSVRDGQTRGLKLYGIRPGSLPKLLGFKNGDLVLSLNGTPLDSMEATMAAYTRLRHADTFNVEIERKGERILKTCDLR